MMYKKYESLLKYEIKHPDFDYKSRNTLYRKRIGRYWNKDGVWYRPSAVNDEVADIFFLGDLLCQEKQIDAARTSNGFDFSYAFDFIRPLFQKADLVCANLETQICDSAPYRNEKRTTEYYFYNNAPIDFLKAVAYSGIDAVVTANNHDFDTGVIGLAETIEHVKNFGLIQTGTFIEDIKRYQMINVRGIKIALTSFTGFHNKAETNLTEEGEEHLLSSYSKLLAEKIYKDAKSNGADLVITYLHSGIEYSVKPSINQKKMINDVAELGYDAIICSHPHVLQVYDELNVNHKVIPVIYSLGNFISHNQKKDAYLTSILKMHIERKKEKYSISCSYIPCCTVARVLPKKYVVIPLCKNAVKIVSKKALDKFRGKIQNAMGEKVKSDITYSVPDVKKIILNWNETIIDKTQLKEKKQRKSLFALYSYKLEKAIEKYDEDVKTFDDFYYVESYHEDTCKIIGYRSPGLRVSIPPLIQNKRVTAIEKYAFSCNTCLSILKFNKNCEIGEIPKGMCKNCTYLSLVRFTVAKNLRVIGEESFSGCTNLKGIEIGKQIEVIKSRAFADCVNLKSVKIGTNTINISNDAFDGCPYLTIYGFKNSYAERYANKLDISFVCMERKINPKATDSGRSIISPFSSTEYITNNLLDVSGANSVYETCKLLGYPIPEISDNPSLFLDLDNMYRFPVEMIETYISRLDLNITLEDAKELFRKFKKYFLKQKNFGNIYKTNCVVWFFDWLIFAYDRGYSHNDYFDFEFYKKSVSDRDRFIGQGYRKSLFRIANTGIKKNLSLVRN